MLVSRGGPRGNPDAKVMCVGEAYGANEDREGQPFVGPAGVLLEGVLAAAGIPPSSVFFTNLVNARPPGNRIRAWVDSAGRPNDILLQGLVTLQADIERINPTVILALGNYPLHFLT